MHRLNVPTLTLAVAFCFFLYSIAGCGGSDRSTRHLDRYDDLPFRDVFTLSSSKEQSYRAAIQSFQQQGYLITLSDPQTGLINAELNTSTLLLEDQKSLETEEKSSGQNIFLTILGIILLFGLIAMIVGSAESDDSKKEEDSSRNNRREPVYNDQVDTRTVSYRYVVTLNASSVDGNLTEIRISATRMRLENGGVVDSGRLQNKYLNYGIVDAIEQTLGR